MKAFGLLVVVLLIGCGSESKDPLFPTKEECQGDPVKAFFGQHQQVISELRIAEREEGFDLDGDGKPDNKLWGLRDLTEPEIKAALRRYELLVPFEFFDVPKIEPDTCVKFAAYLGKYKFDNDGDGKDTAKAGGDCNDQNKDVHPDATEDLTNGIDDNCDGLIDILNAGDVASTKDNDMDNDQVTVGMGDCDDTNANINPNLQEICGDGLDNDCDGNADYSIDDEGNDVCSPYVSGPQSLQVDPLSLDPQNNPYISFRAATLEQEADGLKLKAGPSLFVVNIPGGLGLDIELRITGTTIVGTVENVGETFMIKNARLGGVLDPQSLEGVTGLDVEEVGLKPENSLLDAIFANALKTFLTLPKADRDDFAGCHTPDIDVDQDGLEAFCDSTPTDDDFTVDVCIDGDGTIIRDTVDGQGNVVQCTEARLPNGEYRFRDGISVALAFDTVPAQLLNPVSSSD